MAMVLALVVGALTAVMIHANGELSLNSGVVLSTVIIHTVGLLTQSVVILVQGGIKASSRRVLWYEYGGGVVGVLTVVMTVRAYADLGVAAVGALTLFGMGVASLLIDRFGLLGMPRYALTRRTVVSLMVVACGVAVMGLSAPGGGVWAVLLAVLTGVTTVVARTLNARLREAYNLPMSTLINYISGLLTALLVLVVTMPERVWTPWPQTIGWFAYTGGVIGVVVVTLMTIVVVRLSAYRVTVLTFVAQYGVGLAIDALAGRGPSAWSVAAGLFIVLGTAIDAPARSRRSS